MTDQAVQEMKEEIKEEVRQETQEEAQDVTTEEVKQEAQIGNRSTEIPYDENGNPIAPVEPDFPASAAVLRKYKNKYAGQRCFIIGNGPSLKPADLDKIKENGVFSIASNRIYLIFNDTEWRPDIYTTVDFVGIGASFHHMNALKSKMKIIPVTPKEKVYPVEGAYFVPLTTSIQDYLWMVRGTLPAFSSDITSKVYNGKTITYINFQIAAYLGFKEIILLGVDHFFSRQCYLPDDLKYYDWERDKDHYIKGDNLNLSFVTETKTFEGVKDHFCDNYSDGLDELKISAGYSIEEVTRAYKMAKKYAESHGIKILNATRGGKLNVFKRVNFDSLFPKKK